MTTDAIFVPDEVPAASPVGDISMSLKEIAPFSDLAFIGIAGLNTDPASDIWGLRPLLQETADLYPGASVDFYAWDRAPFESILLPLLQTKKKIILAGHSFGGAKVKQWGEDVNRVLVNGSLKVKPKIYGLFFDPAPNPALGQACDWSVAIRDPRSRWHAPAPFDFSICYHQTNEKIFPGIGVCGVPFFPGKNVVNYNVTKLGLYHCHMVGDSRIQDASRAWLSVLLDGQNDAEANAIGAFSRIVEVD